MRKKEVKFDKNLITQKVLQKIKNLNMNLDTSNFNLVLNSSQFTNKKILSNPSHSDDHLEQDKAENNFLEDYNNTNNSVFNREQLHNKTNLSYSSYPNSNVKLEEEENNFVMNYKINYEDMQENNIFVSNYINYNNSFSKYRKNSEAEKDENNENNDNIENEKSDTKKIQIINSECNLSVSFGEKNDDKEDKSCSSINQTKKSSNKSVKSNNDSKDYKVGINSEEVSVLSNISNKPKIIASIDKAKIRQFNFRNKVKDKESFKNNNEDPEPEIGEKKVKKFNFHYKKK